MSWSPIEPIRAAPLGRAQFAVTASTSAGAGRMRPRLTLTFRAALLKGITWLKPDAGISVLVGHGQHAGMLRIEPNGLHILGKVALAKPAGALVQVKLPLPPGMVAAKRDTVPLEFDFQDGWIEVTLPKWGAAPAAAPFLAPLPPQPAVKTENANGTSMERGKQLAAAAAEMARKKAAGA
jgi:hypothetical protein